MKVNVASSELIEGRSIPEPNSGCWLWEYALTPRGYGWLAVGGRMWLAHRLSWEVHNGPIPPGLCVCHRCDTPACVNPGHFFLGTNAENAADRARKGRTRRFHGEKNAGARLTAAEVSAIRAAIGPQARIAAKFGVSQSTVHRIRSGKLWQHLPAASLPASVMGGVQ